MRGIHNARRAGVDLSQKRLALPPGYRKIFESQKQENSTLKLHAGETVMNSPIQDTDTSSVTFGDFVFMVGYD